MKIYLAHNYAAQSYCRMIRKLVIALGHKVTSRWIDEEGAIDSNVAANICIEDMQSADVIIHFAEQKGETPGEGKFVELGWGLGRGKKLVVIGEGRCVFYAVPNIRKYKDVMSWLESLVEERDEINVNEINRPCINPYRTIRFEEVVLDMSVYGVGAYSNIVGIVEDKDVQNLKVLVKWTTGIKDWVDIKHLRKV